MGVVGVAEMVVVDGLVNLDGLAEAEHDGCFGDLRFINNNRPVYSG